MIVIATKCVRKSGNSLTLNLTKELKAMGLDSGDFVKITLEGGYEDTDNGQPQ